MYSAELTDVESVKQQRKRHCFCQSGDSQMITMMIACRETSSQWILLLREQMQMHHMRLACQLTTATEAAKLKDSICKVPHLKNTHVFPTPGREHV